MGLPREDLLDIPGGLHQSSNAQNIPNVSSREEIERSRHARFSAEEFVTILDVSTIDETSETDGQPVAESSLRGRATERELTIPNGTEAASPKVYQSAMRPKRFSKRDASNSSIGSRSAGSERSRSIASFSVRSRTRKMSSRRMQSAMRQASNLTSMRGIANRSGSTRNGMGRQVRKDEEKIRILALHGKQANKQVTRLQLENLHITPDRYDIVYLKGPIPEESGDPSIENLVNGPFYSWFHSNPLDPRFKPSLLHAIVYLMEAIRDRGPFDAIYGFSQGATIATIVAIAYLDAAMRKAITEEYNDFLWGQETPSQMGDETDRRILLNQQQAQSRKKSFRTPMASVRNLVRQASVSPSSFDDSIFDEEPFSYMILACAVGLPQKLMTAFGFSRDYLEPSSINIPSLHLIGMDDPCRPMGEDMLSFFYGAQTKYMPGGHGISRQMESDKDALRAIHDGLNNLDNGVSMKFSEMTKTSGISSIAPMYKWQVAAVELYGFMDSPTIPALLESHDPSKPLFYDARATDSSKYLSYGDVLNFIRGGPGDLRRLGVKQGEVVAYVAPGNGGKEGRIRNLQLLHHVYFPYPHFRLFHLCILLHFVDVSKEPSPPWPFYQFALKQQLPRWHLVLSKMTLYI